MAKVKKYNIQYNPDKHSHKILMGIPTIGVIRMEWHLAKEHLRFPTCWQHSSFTAYGYQVAEARNATVEKALNDGFDWLFFVDDDVILPNDTLVKLRKYMGSSGYPVVAGIYYCKSSVPEPLIYRGRGHGPYYNWEFGDKVWVDGIHMGLTMIHTSLFRAMKPPWFESPREYIEDHRGVVNMGGTEDLYWCSRVMDEGIIEKAGWKVPDLKNPFLVDTSIFAQHIDIKTGLKYPECCDDQWKINHESARRVARIQERRRLASQTRKGIQIKRSRAA